MKPPQKHKSRPDRATHPARTEARGERLQKILAATGLGSRREIERWIADGRLSVDGEVALLGTRVLISARITLDGKEVMLGAARALPRVIAYHKPEGEMVTRSDPGERRTVFENLPRLRGARWVAVGRLDLNSAGLLLLTDSGELAHRLMHPSAEIEREYAVRAQGALSEDMHRRLIEGVQLDDGMARFRSLEIADKQTGTNRWYRVTLAEGRNREVRRLFEAVGCKVSRLIRIRFGSVTLERDLRPGRWRELTAQEVAQLGAAGVVPSAES